MMLKRKILLCLVLVVCLGFYFTFWRNQTKSEALHYAGYKRPSRSPESMISNVSSGKEESDLIIEQKGIFHQILSKTEEKILEKMKKQVEKELQNYNYHPSLETHDARSLTPIFGGHPVINLLVTTWRSGSTFVGNLLEAHPATMYHYEPIHDFGIVRPKNGPLVDLAHNYLSQLLTCNYTKMERYLNYGKKNKFMFSLNTRLWRWCSKSSGLCRSAGFLSRYCALFPFQAMKTVRLSMNVTEEILSNKLLNVRVLLLVRDPRGTMGSRRLCRWCRGHPACEDPASLCADLVTDYYDAQKLSRLFPGRIKVIRYEDMCFNLERTTREILDFFRLSYAPQVRKFLETHTEKSDGLAYSTFRDSKITPLHWRNDFSYEEVDVIQSKCHRAMDLYGYRLAHSAESLEQLDPVRAFTSPAL